MAVEVAGEDTPRVAGGGHIRWAVLRYLGFAAVPTLIAVAILRYGPAGSDAVGSVAAKPAILRIAPFSDLTLAKLLIAAAVIVGVAHLFGALAKRLGQPRVLGELVAGLALGPSLLGHVAPSVTAYLFTPEIRSYLSMLAQFGVIFFMFLVGLELPLTVLRQRRSTALLVGHASIAIPFLLGVVTALFIPAVYRTSTGSGVAFVAFVGLCMSITAFPVLARILTDRGLSKTPLGALGMATAGIGDITVWCALALVIAAAHGQTTSRAAVTIGATALYAAVMWWVVRPLLRLLVDRWGTRARHGVMVILLFVVLLSALVTDRIGVHAIFGAFLAGLVVPRGTGLVRDFALRVEGLTVWLLLPLYVAVVGLGVRFDQLGSGWLVLVAVTLVGITGKLVGTIVPARSSGMPLKSAIRLGFMMNCRGLTEVIVLNIGVTLGVIGPRLFTVLIGMGVLTTLMTGPLLGRLPLLGRMVTVAPTADGGSGTAPTDATPDGPLPSAPEVPPAAVTDDDKEVASHGTA